MCEKIWYEYVLWDNYRINILDCIFLKCVIWNYVLYYKFFCGVTTNKLNIFCSWVLYIVRYVWKYKAMIYIKKKITVWELLDQVVTIYTLFITIHMYAIQHL